MSKDTHENLEQAAFGAGCFWGVEETFRNMPGVENTEVGFMGGSVKDPSYERVCEGDTDHVEVVHLYFDPQKISYEVLLEKFWLLHNPTTPNRQGPDMGTQYRSVIFYYSAEQQKVAENMKNKLTTEKRFADPIVTTIEKAKVFYKAEEYHQRYLAKRGLGTCHV